MTGGAGASARRAAHHIHQFGDFAPLVGLIAAPNGVIDVATDKVETSQQVEQVIVEVMKFVRKDKIVACTNCGMAPMRRDIAAAKLMALGQGVALARKKFG